MKNIVITGFMGTGKTAVGRAVARLLGREFVDIDERIEKEAGASVQQIFVREGQETFRGMERDVCRELSERQDLVIATGGGTLIDQENRELMMKSGIVICLLASTEEIMNRLTGTGVSKRPLLEGSDLRGTIETLLQERREIYHSFPWQVDTTNMTVEEVAKRVIEISRSVTIPVSSPAGGYEIMIGDGLLDRLGLILKGKITGRIAIVTNTVVSPLYATTLERSLRDARFDPFICVIPDGESHKRIETVEHLYEEFLAGGLDRGGTVISLGGGVTGDIAGFAAATFMRGVKFVQVPTTLLAMVDASVGGKTGVDLPQGKNLVGAFKFPQLVLIDPRVLTTLPEKEIRNGAAEAIKHGILADVDLFDHLRGGPLQFSPQVIERILMVKVKIVEEDPYERGRREVLNLGHTVGHAIEQVSGFSLPHGEAVAIGLVAAARIAVRLSLADSQLVDRIEGALSAWGLPTRVPQVSVDEIIASMAHDKKRLSGRLRFVIPRKISRVEVVDDVPEEAIRAVLTEMKGD